MGLYKIAENSDIMDIDITYRNKRYKFNLAEELKIKEGKMGDKLKQHATSYSFLTQLLTHLETQVEDLERQVKKIYDLQYIKAKKAPAVGRVMSDDLCKATAGASVKYQDKIKALIKAKHAKGVIGKAVRAYEARKDLMQTLSANARNER